jgi:two-component system capsular synthesis sensor histidine kinase RcsC
LEATDDDLALGSGETILVVEDNLATRNAVVSSLELLNYEVLQASNGQEALHIFKNRHSEITLVLSDLVMPEMSGKALTQALHQHTPKVPVIIMSGHPLDSESEDLHKMGIQYWIQKPPNLENLAQTLAKALKSPRV